MPLVRFRVRNQYGLGQPELYAGADGEDPKAVLEGVAVAGLVGILRQLGDLAEFAGEVFHGLQEQVTATASRSRKLMVRVQNIEAALPPIEKAIQAQTSHIHFAYTAGLEWHPRIRNEQNHFIYNDLPRFIMDSYEECRDPPRLHLLDRFDTGGPGSSIKRYSDPTFFKRVSTSSNEKNTEKPRKDKKTRKIKKKRSSSLRNGEFSRGTSIYSCSGRMQFASSIGNGEASPSQTPSTVDMNLKSEPGENLNSFDSRTGLSYIECVFPRGSSMQSEEHDTKKASPTSLQHNDNIDSVFSNEHGRVVDNIYQHDSFEEKIAPSSSCVSWEEKEEIVEPKVQQYEEDEDQNQDILLQKSERDSLSNVDQMNTLFDDENAPASTSGKSELDDMESKSELDGIESETDNYVDALNTIESESEYDIDCQTIREVEQDSKVSHKDLEDEINCASTHESDTKSYCFLNKGVPSDLPTAASSESVIHENKPANMEISSPSDHSPGTDICGSVDTHDESKLDSMGSNALPSGSSDHDSLNQSGKTVITSISGSQESSENVIHENKPVNMEITCTSDNSPGIDICGSVYTHDESKLDSMASNASPSGSSDHDSLNQSGKMVITSISGSQESPTEISGCQSVKLWTNGGLLGLQPSKPPDFSVSNTIRESRSEKETAGPSNHAFTIKECEDKGKVSMLIENDRSIQKSLSSNNSAFATFAQANPNGKNKESNCLVNGNRSSHGNESGQTVPSLASDGNDTSIVSSLENDEKSSLMFGLSHRLLVNGFRRKLALAPDDKPLSSTSLERIHETTFRKQLECELPEDSLTSSPPLEHMKISFRPVNGFETSKLKLKFPDGCQSLESVDNLFPSFQLVPDSDIPLREAHSDSDDDTFCRSSPYMSDDCNSIDSELNSEEWEVGENNGNEDQELYDAFCRVSGTESVSSSPDLWEAANNADGNHLSIETDIENSLSVHQPESKCDSDPLPPPLPPVQWRLLKSHPEMEEGPHDASKFVEPSISQQARLDLVVQQQINKETVGFKPKSKPEINGHKEANQASNGKEVVEKEDFLHQIRTQSFNLRRTTPAKPAPVTPTSNVSVTAILEKANAIRQAVASDDGEEDAWSDT